MTLASALLGRITIERIDETLGRIVAQRGPDHRDHTKDFWWGASPGCVVGTILAEWGMTREMCFGYNHNSCVVNSATAAVDYLALDIEAGAAVYLSALQNQNDSGVPWGLIAERAKKLMRSWHEYRPTDCSTCGSRFCKLMAEWWARPFTTRTPEPTGVEPPAEVPGVVNVLGCASIVMTAAGVTTFGVADGASEWLKGLSLELAPA